MNKTKLDSASEQNILNMLMESSTISTDQMSKINSTSAEIGKSKLETAFELNLATEKKILNQLKLIVEGLIKKSDVGDIKYKIRLQENKDKEHGDYASNIAMILAKDLSENPKNLAKQINI